jgi:hypothetical protein
MTQAGAHRLEVCEKHVPTSTRTNIKQGQKPAEAAVCLRAPARNFAETIDSVVPPSADRGNLRYTILSYDSLA